MKTINLFSKAIGVLALAALPAVSHAFHPCVDLVKEVSNDGGLTWHDANTEAEAIPVSNSAMYKFTVTGCYLWYGSSLVNTVVTDNLLNLYQIMPDKAMLENDLSASFTVDAPGICSGYTGTIKNTATVLTTGVSDEFPGMDVELTDSDDAWIRCEPPVVTEGGEGCTPGYWKQPQHFDSWPAGITPDALYSSVFGRVITVRTGDGNVTNPTLLQALSALGGKVNTAARHSTAAYLNSVSSGVSYDLSATQVISNAQSSIDNNDFGALIEALVNFNEQGCPLN